MKSVKSTTGCGLRPYVTELGDKNGTYCTYSSHFLHFYNGDRIYEERHKTHNSTQHQESLIARASVEAIVKIRITAGEESRDASRRKPVQGFDLPGMGAGRGAGGWITIMIINDNNNSEQDVNNTPYNISNNVSYNQKQ